MAYPSIRRFGEKMRALRQQKGISQRRLAEELGFGDQAFIHRLETGEKRPNVEHVLRVSEYFGVSIDALVKDTEEVDVGE